MRIFIVGQFKYPHDDGCVWDYQGVFTCKRSAIEACVNDRFFFFEHVLNTELPIGLASDIRCIYPLEIGTDGKLYSIDDLGINYWHDDKVWYTNDEWCHSEKKPATKCGKCSGEYCVIHGVDPCDCDVLDRH